MPKKKKVESSSSLDGSKESSNSCHSYSAELEVNSQLVEKQKEWEEARCAVCMDHPHNAVLLLCSSSGKGCRPYMCNTSDRHSGCLKQYRKSSTASASTEEAAPGNGRPVSKLVCPLCRGCTKGWEVNDSARRFMNLKSRSCSVEGCDFSGSYSDLRVHVRPEHSSTCPSKVDSKRREDWTRFEQEQELEDLLLYQSTENSRENYNETAGENDNEDWLPSSESSFEESSEDESLEDYVISVCPLAVSTISPVSELIIPPNTSPARPYERRPRSGGRALRRYRRVRTYRESNSV